MYLVYFLVDDAAQNEPRYVGVTGRSLRVRLTEHLRESRRQVHTRKANWIRSVLVAGRTIAIREVASATCPDEIHQIEQQIIVEQKILGARLTNSSDGGYGGVNPTEDIREKIAASKRGKPRPPNVGEAVRRARTGAKSPAVSEANRNRVWTEEMRQRFSEARRGKKHRPHQWSEQGLLNNRLLHLGKRHSAESRAKMSRSRTGKYPTHETRVKLSEARRLWWAQKKADVSAVG